MSIQEQAAALVAAVDPAAVAGGQAPIFAAANFVKELSDEGIATLPIVATRASCAASRA